MIEYSILLSSLVLVLIICCIVISKKAPLIACVLLAIFYLCLLIKKVDPTYYEGLIDTTGSNDDLEKLLFNYTLVLLCITISTVMLKVCIKTRKLNTGLGTLLKKSTVDKKILNDFDSFSDEYCIIKYDSYYLNKAFKSLLNSDEAIINQETFKSNINASDINSYDKNSFFRIGNTNSWFAKSNIVYQGTNLCVIRKVIADDYSNITMEDYNAMNAKVNELMNQKIEFGIITIHVSNVFIDNDVNNVYEEVNDLILRSVLISKYLLSLKNFFDNQLINIYSLGSNEFSLIINKKNLLDFLVNKIKINDGILTDFIYFIDDKRYVIKTKTLITYSIDMKEEGLTILARLIQFVLSSNYNAFVYNSNEVDTKRDVIQKLDVNLNNDIV